ncbi:MAG: ribonuclease J [Synergistaceae bacterium]|jgi:ribonuclease J|nr:ribonuclease J [Synergistaceae bacterium]
MPNAKRGRRSGAAAPERTKHVLKIIPLGGLGEIGKNLTAIEYDDDIIVIDCGLKFPEEEMLGIDFVIPDVQYLIEKKHKIRGIFLTHGHEDHIGAIPLVIPRLDVPLYGAPLTLALVEHRMLDTRTPYKPEYNIVLPGQTVRAGCFEVGFIRVAHSIPDSMAIYVRTPLGVVVHSGDFKLDMTPIGGTEGTDLASLAALGKEGVTLLLSDSTNSERPGFTPSEAIVGRTFEDIFRRYKDRRIIIAAFASNLYRASQVFAIAARFNRKVLLLGRSMVSYVELAMKLGYIDAPPELFVTSQEADHMAPNRTVVLTTGSQGEPFSGLVLMSKAEHKQIRLGDRDIVVISATPIPGNEKLVSNTINRLFVCGCDVIYERDLAVHASGHASREEQKILLNLIKPKFFMPVHGEYRHLVRHSQLALEMGIPTRNIFVLQNGDVLELDSGGKAKFAARVESGSVLVDGVMLGEFEGSLLRERKELSESGVLAISLVLNDENRLVAKLQIDSRGSIYGFDSENMRPDVETAVERALEGVRAGAVDRLSLPSEIRKKIREILGRNYRAYPGIIPLISIIGAGDTVQAQEKESVPKAKRTGRPRRARNQKKPAPERNQ